MAEKEMTLEQATDLSVAKKGNNLVFVGKVTGLFEGTGKAEGKVVTIGLSCKYRYGKGGDDDYGFVNIPFWNSDKEDGDNLADRVRKMNPKKGSAVLVKAYYGKAGLVGVEMRYDGYVVIKEDKDDDKPISVLMGTVVSTRHNDEHGVTNAMVPMTISKDVTQYAQVGIWNTDKRPKAADDAERLLSPKEDGDSKQYARAYFVCGKPKKSSYTNKEGEEIKQTQMSCFQWGYVPRNKKQDVAEDFAPVDEEDNLPFGDGIPEEEDDSLPWN